MMTDRWRQISALYYRALALPARERQAFVEGVCAGDEALRSEVDALLAVDASSAMVDTPAFEGAARALAHDRDSMPGRLLGAYKIVSFLGAGGMGEVYRAIDTTLGREVALKILPPVFLADRERRARFEREARLLAALNHPNVAAIYGFEDAEGTPALVLELVEGETLAERLEIAAKTTGGGLPLGEAIAIARHLAEALEAAHEKGIIHRDLKPANIKITPDGHVKVLDFGLAKTLDVSAVDLPHGSLTLTLPIPYARTILGTPAYISPEQASGLKVDRRADVWAFGCVLYETLTGRPTFKGETSEVITAILERDPDWSALPAATPASIRRVLRRCLEKDPKRRIHDIADARIELDDVSESAVNPATVAGDVEDRQNHRRILFGIAWLALGATLGLASYRLAYGPHSASEAASGRTVGRFTEALPSDSRLAPAPALAISADGRTVAYVVDQRGGRLLYARELQDASARPLPGTDGAEQPFFSPDGRWIAFFADAKLKKVPLVGGSPLVLVDGVVNPRGGTWAIDDAIIFSPSPTSPLVRVSANGGPPQPITTLDRDLNEASHRWPYVLPDGDTLLFAAGPTVTAKLWNEAHVVAQSLRTHERHVVTAHGTFPRFLPSGHVVFVHDQVVYAQSFNIARLESAGNAVPILENATQFGGINGGAYQLGLSPAGTLAYFAGTQSVATSMVWVDRDGKEEALPFPSRGYVHPRISPDGQKVAVTIVGSAGSEVWVYDIARRTTARLGVGDRNLWPVWAAGGTRVAYASSRDGSTNLYWRPADESGPEERLTSSSFTTYATSSTQSGSTLALTDVTNGRGPSLVLLSLEKNREARLFYQAADQFRVGSAAIAPDGRWVAYVSNEYGRNEVFVRPTQGSNASIQVSTDGGEEPMWASNSRELFFRRGNALLAVEIKIAQKKASVGLPRELFHGSYLASGLRAAYDVAPDGRFLFVKNQTSPVDPTRFTIVMNWTSELVRRFSTP